MNELLGTDKFIKTLKRSRETWKTDNYFFIAVNIFFGRQSIKIQL